MIFSFDLKLKAIFHYAKQEAVGKLQVKQDVQNKKIINTRQGKTANYYMGTKCVSGYIEIINKRTFLENYLDSDIEQPAF